MSYMKRVIENMEDGMTEEQAIAKVQAEREAEPDATGTPSDDAEACLHGRGWDEYCPNCEGPVTDDPEFI